MAHVIGELPLNYHLFCSQSSLLDLLQFESIVFDSMLELLDLLLLQFNERKQRKELAYQNISFQTKS